MAAQGLIVSKLMDVTIARLQVQSLLDMVAIEEIGNSLYSLVDDRACRKIIVDFSKVSFLSSQMLGVLAALNKKSKAIKGKVVLCGLRPSLREIFKVMGLDKIMTFADDESAAMKEFKAIG